MSYPQPSSFVDPAPFSAWFLHRAANGAPQVCSATGYDVLADLQSELATRLQDNPALVGPDGTPAIGLGSIQVNDPLAPSRGWNGDLLRALWAVASDARAPSAYLAAIAADAASGVGPVSPSTLQAGLWIGEHYYKGFDAATGADVFGVGSPDEVQIPANATRPAMDAPPPAPSNAGAQYISAGASCNVVPASVAATIPVAQTVVPFRFSELAVFGVLAVATAAIVLLSRDVPVISPEVRARQAARRVRSNPVAVRRSSRRDRWTGVRRALANPAWWPR